MVQFLSDHRVYLPTTNRGIIGTPTPFNTPIPVTTPSQRVQVLLKPTVLDIVKDLASEEDLTLSKTVALLVHEALEARGLYSRPKQRTHVPQPITIPDGATTVARKVEPFIPEDQELLLKLKALKELGIL